MNSLRWRCGLFFLVSVCAHAQAPNLEVMDVVIKSVPDGPVAKVNGNNIPRRDFINLYMSELQVAVAASRGNNVPDGARIKLALWCVGTLVEREILHQEAVKGDIVVAQSEIDAAWLERVSRMRQRTETTGGAEPTEDQLIAGLGFADREALMLDLRRYLMIQQIRERLLEGHDVSVTDDEVQVAYERDVATIEQPPSVKMRQIFFRAPTGTGPGATQRRREAYSKAEEALARIQSGQRFEGVARTSSEGSDRASGGEVGPIPLQELPPFFVKALLSMVPNQVSEIIESEFGIHIIQLLERHEGSLITLEQATPIIRERLAAQKSEEFIRDHCDGIVQSEGRLRVFLELEKNFTLGSDDPDLRIR